MWCVRVFVCACVDECVCACLRVCVLLAYVGGCDCLLTTNITLPLLNTCNYDY